MYCVWSIHRVTIHFHMHLGWRHDGKKGKSTHFSRQEEKADDLTDLTRPDRLDRMRNTEAGSRKCYHPCKKKRGAYPALRPQVPHVLIQLIQSYLVEALHFARGVAPRAVLLQHVARLNTFFSFVRSSNAVVSVYMYVCVCGFRCKITQVYPFDK